VFSTSPTKVSSSSASLSTSLTFSDVEAIFLVEATFFLLFFGGFGLQGLGYEWRKDIYYPSLYPSIAIFQSWHHQA
jgi:hypothetical protein